MIQYITNDTVSYSPAAPSLMAKVVFYNPVLAFVTPDTVSFQMHVGLVVSESPVQYNEMLSVEAVYTFDDISSVAGTSVSNTDIEAVKDFLIKKYISDNNSFSLGATPAITLF